jgi:Zn-dependent protease with chaperone function
LKFVPKKLERTEDISRGKSTPRDAIKNVVSALVVLGGVYLLLLGAATLLARFIPDETEARWFSWEMVPSGDASTAEFERARKIFEKLKRQPGLRNLPYELFVMEMDAPNAAAFPGGRVGVTPDLLKNVNSDAGLALVLAHELGHHQHRDCLQRLGFRLLLQAVIAVVSFGADPSTIYSGYAFLELAHSRDQERKADAFGLRLVKQALGTTRGSLEFFEYIKREHESGASRWAAWFATHPVTDERIRNLRALQVQLE